MNKGVSQVENSPQSHCAESNAFPRHRTHIFMQVVLASHPSPKTHGPHKFLGICGYLKKLEKQFPF